MKAPSKTRQVELAKLNAVMRPAVSDKDAKRFIELLRELTSKVKGHKIPAYKDSKPTG